MSLLWETAILNKIYKTQEFRRIKPQEGIGKTVFVIGDGISKSKKPQTVQEAKDEKIFDEGQLFDQYGISDLKQKAKDILYYSKFLYFYHCVFDITSQSRGLSEEAIQAYQEWVGLAFRHFHGLGPETTPFSHSEPGLQHLNKYLSLRPCIVPYEISALDIIIISALRRNNEVWEEVKNDKEQWAHIHRWVSWVEGISEVHWDAIYKRSQKAAKSKKNQNKKKVFTGSQELIDAVTQGNTKKVQKLLDQNPLWINSVDIKMSKASLAHIACKHHNLEMLKLLISYKVDLEAKDRKSQTPIFWCFDGDNTEVPEFLISQDVNLAQKDTDGRTVLYFASRRKALKCMKLLIDSGCDPNEQTKLCRTALSQACRNNYLDVVQVLLESGKCDLTFKNTQGKTALHIAVRENATDQYRQQKGICEKDSIESTQLLLEHGADPNIPDCKGNTALHIACSRDARECIRMLLSFGANLNQRNNFGVTPFLSACYRDNPECVEVLYEYPELDTKAKTSYGYDALELAIASGSDRMLKWVIDSKVQNGQEYPGLELSTHDPEKLLHHAINNPETNCIVLSQLLNYFWNYSPEVIVECFNDVLNRAMLRGTKDAVRMLLNFYKENKINEKLMLSQPILEASVHLDDFDVFNEVMSNYFGNLPQMCLQSVIYHSNELILEVLLHNFADQFMSEDCYKDITELPAEFTKIIDKDVLEEYTYFDKVAHPIFSNQQVFREYWNYDPLQMAVHKDNSRMVKLLLERTLYKVSKHLPNGDNLLHLMVQDRFGDSFIMQKLLDRLEQEVGSAEAVKKDFLMAKSDADGLSVIEYCAGSKTHAPVIFKYSSVAGLPEDDMYSQSTVLDVEFVHKMTLEEEEKLDKTEYNNEIRKYAKTKFKQLIKDTENLAKQSPFVQDFAKELGLDLSDISYLKKIPTIKNKPCKFIDTIEELKVCCQELEGHKVIGVDLEFSGDKRVTVASLVQISSVDSDYIIDALVLRHSMGPYLTPIFADPDVVKVLHGCDYDIVLLLTDLEVEVLNVFDTGKAFKTMQKTCCTSEPLSKSFEYLVNELLDIKTNKFFQVAEWRLRPLPKVMMNYSRADSHYLLYIYAIMIELMATQNEVALQKSAFEDNQEWLNFRKEHPEKWGGVLKDFQKKMAKFMVQKIEKSGERTYEVVVHHAEST